MGGSEPDLPAPNGERDPQPARRGRGAPSTVLTYVAPAALIGLIIALAVWGIPAILSRQSPPSASATQSFEDSAPGLLASPSTGPTPHPSPSPLPSPTTDSVTLLDEAERAVEDGNFGAAAAGYREVLDREIAGGVDPAIALATAYLREGAYGLAVDALRAYTASGAEGDSRHVADFLLAEALRGAGDAQGAADHYGAYISDGTVITGYVRQWLGDALHEAGDYAGAIEAYDAALVESPDRSFTVGLREKMALAHVAQEDYASAIAEYEAILSVAEISSYRAYIEYQAAETELLSGEREVGLARHLRVVESYPTALSAHGSLVRLVEAGRPVDDLLRGIVDYYGEAYEPAVAVLRRNTLESPAHSGDAHWYAGLSFLELDDPLNAAREFRLLIDTHSGNEHQDEAWIGLALALRAAGDVEGAVAAYEQVADEMASSPLAAESLWEAAVLLERSGELGAAAEGYLECQARYPASDYAPQALFRSGLQSFREGDLVAAAVAWETLAATYSTPYFRAAALFWLGRLRSIQGDVGAAAEAFEEARAADPRGYYGLRAAQLAADATAAVFPVSPYSPATVTSADQDEAEAWLAEWLGIDRRSVSGEIGPLLMGDLRLARGLELWRLGRFVEGRAELDGLRLSTEDDALAQYQLALLFRDIGLYRSSILSAVRAVVLSPAESVLEAPLFIARLAYPDHYERLVTQHAAEYDLDPLLVFAQVRQESLFESLATSTASAHGLMQVIPPTGAQIAAALEWPPGYETSDLYRPYVSVRFGTFYLGQQRDSFDGRLEVALAAYNGGPDNATRWSDLSGDDADLFVELITFSETRQYVRRIREQLAIYQALYGG